MSICILHMDGWIFNLVRLWNKWFYCAVMYHIEQYNAQYDAIYCPLWHLWRHWRPTGCSGQVIWTLIGVQVALWSKVHSGPWHAMYSSQFSLWSTLYSVCTGLLILTFVLGSKAHNIHSFNFILLNVRLLYMVIL